ncbi:MAG: tRNA (adenosine(37)-N6)-threonylcarbamoyltransferase complex ATPase subunit type 1 TsaE [marine bacterium B5-7]|nr:MAG: tRNA (adenosine(37)-N6)-threonylcarbamoyltransferase complex ATPase subunit type 1 TsaE [marine bacterium B5-7]
MNIVLPDEQSTEALGARLAPCLPERAMIFLDGDLGMGKTTLVRGLLRALGVTGPVKSPTFTLVEPYELDERTVYHFDLYRTKTCDEIEGFGFRDYVAEDAICCIEWPQRAAGMLPTPDLMLTIRLESSSRQLEILSVTPKGDAIMECFSHAKTG